MIINILKESIKTIYKNLNTNNIYLHFINTNIESSSHTFVSFLIFIIKSKI